MGTQLPLPQRGTAPSNFQICDQMAELIKMSLGMELGLGPGDFLLDGVPAPSLQKGGRAPPQFSAHVYCAHMAGWMKLVLGMVVGLRPSDFVLDGDPAPPFSKRGQSPLTNFRPISIVAKRLDASCPHHKRGGGWGQSPPNFRPMAIVAQRLDG